jgi:hypothetical protein
MERKEKNLLYTRKEKVTAQPAREQQEKSDEYEIGILGKCVKNGHSVYSVTDLYEAGVDEYVQELADWFSSGDIRIRDDINAIIREIKGNPYGEGVTKLKRFSVTIDLKSIPLWSFDPRGRKGITLQHDISPSLRVAYAVMNNGENRRVLIEGVYRHCDFDKRFK